MRFAVLILEDYNTLLMHQITESAYPSTFRADDAKALRQHLSHHDSVVLIGMKRVGISNFLRFFLSQPKDDHTTYIVVDLNNLVEKTIFAFWILTLKRIVDVIEESSCADAIKDQARATFTESIQLRDQFFTIESIHKLIQLLAAENIFVTIFFLRFDRMREAITNEFFANIRGLQEGGTHLSYLFTSYRPLYEIAPDVFFRSALPSFCEEMYLKPASSKDMEIILSSFQERYGFTLPPDTTDAILNLAGGHVQYLHLILLKLKKEKIDPKIVRDAKAFKALLAKDEEIRFLSEELFSSLSEVEQDVLKRANKEALTASESVTGKYLWDTGMLLASSKLKFFSPLFQSYVSELLKNKQSHTNDFTKKEHLLFSILLAHENELVERALIIEAVWPDEVEYGISDWSIDRLISRVRGKLRSQNSPYKIVTVITRGYKVVQKSE